MGKLPETFTGPGLVDLQVNGYAGFSFNDDPASWKAGDFAAVRDAQRKRGVVAALPTLVTDDSEAMLARAVAYDRIVSSDEELAAAFPRLHIEGPFLSPDDGPRGAHPLAHCKTPDDLPDLIDRLNEASGGRVAIITLAPELPGAMDLTRRCVAQGICVAIGHTNATGETIDRAVEAGATMSTHLGNGSHAMLPRLDNYVQAQLADDRLSASFIADAHHMPLTTLKNFIRAKTVHRSVLVTDAIAAAEMEAGRYELAGEVLIVTDEGRVSHEGEENYLAGSAATLDMCVIRTCLHCDVSFEQAWAMASTRPADTVNLPRPGEVTVKVSGTGFALQ